MPATDPRAKFASWIERRRTKVSSYRLAHETAAGREVVQTWECEELDASDGPGCAEVVYSVAQDHCDSIEESAQYRFECLDDHGNVRTSIGVRCRPELTDDASPAQMRAHEANVNGIVSHFLTHDTAKTKILVASLQTVLTANKQTLELQMKMLEHMGRFNLELQQQLAAARAAAPEREAEADPEEVRAEAVARQQAWNKLTELAPMVVNAITRTYAERYSDG